VEQRRLLIAIVVSLLLVIAYQELVLTWYKKPHPAARPPEPPRASEPAPAPEPSTDLAVAPGGDSVLVETDVLRVRITPTGARLAEVELKSYRRSVASDSQPLDLVDSAPVLPAALQLDAGRSDATLAYRPDRSALDLHGDDQGEVVFVADSPDGLHVEKRYRFSGNGYLFELTAALSGVRAPATVGLVLTPLAAETPTAAAGQVAVAFANRRLVEQPFKSLAKEPHPVPGASWAGFAEHYFLSAAMPPEGTAPALLTVSDGVPVVRLDAPVVDGQAKFAVYTGPKDREVLSRAGHDLDRALDFGWFWFVAIPLLRALRWLERMTGNYGVAIIALTALAKLVTAPLTQTTFRNMREMQKIQPQMAKLRERLKGDQVALQKEMMELYRRHRVNPFSGCVPMLLQLPIFVGLYNALSRAIELRHAPFALWINDLSAPDRLMIPGIAAGTPLIGGGVPVLTLLMGASMFLQQWLTPQQGDPTQQRMMMFMPLVFTFMFINFPAGLVLYWLVNNLLTIGQQYLMMRSAN
jgi:YidC/Oxa1 family membrane protein insertase